MKDMEHKTTKTRMAAFTVYGDPVPHLSVTYRSKGHPENDRAKRVAAYKEDVRKSALVVGVKVPIPSRDRPVIVDTRIYFRTRLHGDPESVHKAIKDALWPARDGGDKFTGGSYSIPLYDPKNPRVVVSLEWEDDQRRKP